jgi:hypothetical protein
VLSIRQKIITTREILVIGGETRKKEANKEDQEVNGE